MKDIPARRMASVIEFALTIAIGFGFLARRYGAWVGLVAAGSLLLMPRLYGQAHLIDTDIPGPLALGGDRPGVLEGLARAERAGAGGCWSACLLGLAFVEKMAAVGVLLPLLLWLVAGHLPRSFTPAGCPGRLDRRHGHVGADAAAAGPGVPGDPELAAAVAAARPDGPVRPSTRERLAGRDPGRAAGGLAPPAPAGPALPRSPVWGVERPALETWTAILAFAPVVGWLATRPGGGRRCPGWPTTTRSAATAGAPCPTSRSSISARSTSTACPGTTPGC